MTRTEWLAANLNGPSIETLKGRREPVPLYRQRFTGSAADAGDHEAIILDSITRHAERDGVALVGSAILMDSTSTFSAYFITTSRRDIASDDEAIARFATIAAQYGEKTVMLKVIEFHREPFGLDWRVSPPRPYSRQPRSLDHLCSLVERDLIDALTKHVAIRSAVV